MSRRHHLETGAEEYAGLCEALTPPIHEALRKNTERPWGGDTDGAKVLRLWEGCNKLSVPKGTAPWIYRCSSDQNFPGCKPKWQEPNSKWPKQKEKEIIRSLDGKVQGLKQCHQACFLSLSLSLFPVRYFSVLIDFSLAQLSTGPRSSSLTSAWLWQYQQKA